MSAIVARAVRLREALKGGKGADVGVWGHGFLVRMEEKPPESLTSLQEKVFADLEREVFGEVSA